MTPAEEEAVLHEFAGPVPGHWAGISSPIYGYEFRDRVGRCYEMSGAITWGLDLSNDHPGWKLVHGSIERPPLPRIGHAWCEWKGMVFDPVLDYWISWREYRQWGRARRVKTYTVAQATELIQQSGGHAGPWHSAPFGRDD